VAPDKVPSVYEQTRQALALIDRSLADAGTDKTRVLTAVVYLVDMAQKPAMNQAWEEWVSLSDPPMRACIGVAALEGQDLVEILVTAALPERG
jgi:enamine deaminase RidA (YjgF/YER057c/UK114 family)